MKQLFTLTLLVWQCCTAFAQFNFHQDLINESLEKAHQQSLYKPTKNFSITGQSSQSSLNSLLSIQSKLKQSIAKLPKYKSQKNIDTLIFGFPPNDTVIITGNYTQNGPIIGWGNGVLIIKNATANLLGNIYLLGNSKAIIDSSTVYIPQQYIYERSILVIQHAQLVVTHSTLDFSGMSHNLYLADSASAYYNHVQQNDWTTAGVWGHSIVSINNTNLCGEYILSEQGTSQFKNASTLLLWHHFDGSSNIQYAFPNGANVYHYQFNALQPGVSGVQYQVNVDSTSNVMWGIMPENGSTVNLSNSNIRAVGCWFRHSDTISVGGLVNNSNYNNFTAPLADRTLHFQNCQVQTWSLYAFDSSQVDITGCGVGEVGSQQKSSINSNNYYLDGSGGYFWSTDTTVQIAANVAVNSHVQSQGNSLFVFAYGSIGGLGYPSAIKNSFLAVIQSTITQDPIPYENGVCWYQSIDGPAVSYTNYNVPIMGSAWIDGANVPAWMDMTSYKIYYKQTTATAWTLIGTSSNSEVHHNVLANWNTMGLNAGSYDLKMVMFNTFGDSVESHKSISLNTGIVAISEQPKFDVKAYPNPFNKQLNIIGAEEVLGVKIFSVDGRLVLQQSLNEGMKQIDTQFLSPGIYTLQMQTHGKLVFQQITKE